MRTPCCHKLAALVLIAAALPQLGCSGGKYDSPEACFRTMQVAAHNKDMPAVCECLTDESQETLAGMLVMAGSMMKLQGSSPGVVAVLEKHGVTDDVFASQPPALMALAGSEGIRNFAKLVKDKAAFIADMYAAMLAQGQSAKFSEQFEQQLAGKIKDVTIDGDQATAVVVTSSGEDPLEFRKTAVGWKLHINFDRVGSGAAAPPA